MVQAILKHDLDRGCFRTISYYGTDGFLIIQGIHCRLAIADFHTDLICEKQSTTETYKKSALDSQIIKSITSIFARMVLSFSKLSRWLPGVHQDLFLYPEREFTMPGRQNNTFWQGVGG